MLQRLKRLVRVLLRAPGACVLETSYRTKRMSVPAQSGNVQRGLFAIDAPAGPGVGTTV